MSGKNPETKEPNGYKLARVQDILDNQQVFQLFMSAINERVGRGLRERYERNRILLVGILTLIAIVVTAFGGTWLDWIVRTAVKPRVDAAVEQSVKATIEKAVSPAVNDAVDAAVMEEVRATVGEAVEDAVNEAIDDTVKSAVNEVVEGVTAIAIENAVETAREDVASAVQFEAQVASLNFRVLSLLELADSFATQDANSIINDVEALYSRRSDPEGHEQLRFAVETAAKNFIQANRLDLAVRLEDVAPEVVKTSTLFLEVMIQAQGQQLLGDAGAPRSWGDPLGLKAAYDSYRAYASKAELTGYPELYLAYEMLLGYVANRPEEEIKELIVDTSNLNDVDAANFVAVVVNLATVRSGVPRTKRIAARVKEFLCTFRDQGGLLLAVREQANVRC